MDVIHDYLQGSARHKPTDSVAAVSMRFLASGGNNDTLSVVSSDVDAKVRTAVSERWRLLLSTAQTLMNVRKQLADITTAASLLSAQAGSALTDLTDPVASLVSRRAQLNATLSTSSLLRSLQRFLQLAGRLRTHLPLPNELHLAALDLTELLLLCEDSRCARINVIQREIPLLRNLKRILYAKAFALLGAELGAQSTSPIPDTAPGMEIGDIGSFGTALHVLFFLAELPRAFTELVAQIDRGKKLIALQKLSSSVSATMSKANDEKLKLVFDYKPVFPESLIGQAKLDEIIEMMELNITTNTQILLAQFVHN